MTHTIRFLEFSARSPSISISAPSALLARREALPLGDPLWTPVPVTMLRVGLSAVNGRAGLPEPFAGPPQPGPQPGPIAGIPDAGLSRASRPFWSPHARARFRAAYTRARARRDRSADQRGIRPTIGRQCWHWSELRSVVCGKPRQHPHGQRLPERFRVLPAGAGKNPAVTNSAIPAGVRSRDTRTSPAARRARHRRIRSAAVAGCASHSSTAPSVTRNHADAMPLTLFTARQLGEAGRPVGLR